MLVALATMLPCSGGAEHGHLAAVGVDAERPGPHPVQFPDEESRAAADVDDDPPVKLRVLAELVDGVPGERGVVGLRGRLLGAECPEQPDRTRQIRTECLAFAHDGAHLTPFSLPVGNKPAGV